MAKNLEIIDEEDNRRGIYCRVWTNDGTEDLTKPEWYFFIEKRLHRLGGPAAVFASGGKCWRVNGIPHRIDGPAIERLNGRPTWWLNGKRLPRKEVEKWLKEHNIDLKTEEGQMAFKLMWS